MKAEHWDVTKAEMMVEKMAEEMAVLRVAQMAGCSAGLWVG